MDIKKIYHYTKDLTVLYVEDDLAISKNIVDILKMFFKEVYHRANGLEGLKLYKEKKEGFDIVLADIYMPEMDGIEMIENILEINPKQQISVFSAQDDPVYLRRLINLGVSSFLLKPIREKQLMMTLLKLAKTINNEKLLQKYLENMKDENAKLEEKLYHTLKTDNLTGLKNREALVEDINKMSYTMLAFLDLDHFQFINDLYGTEVGDEVIKKFANFLENKVKDTDFSVYHTAGDEFAICSYDKDSTRFEKFIKNLSEEVVNLVLYIDEIKEEISIDASIGVTYELSLMASFGMIFESSLLLVQANTALKYAKKHNKSLVTYSESINTLQYIQKTLEWKDKIKHAYENDDIVAVFQPIVDKDGKIAKYETLMRLRLKEDGETKLISPYFFLETAIITKQYPKISKVIIQQALDRLKEDSTITLSINLTFSDVQNPDILQLLEDELKRNDIGSRLIVEIVESEDIKDYSILIDFLEKLKSYGVKVAIDDFGSGFSNFENIIKYGTDYIKIDGSLIKKIDTDKNSYAIVKAISEFAHALGIKVIAEFVHSKEVLEVLKDLKVDEFQGFYFYEPTLEIVKDKEAEVAA